jgi:hypothetical protein
MYFSQMFCYGFDNDIVGISGIVGCMGVIFVGHGSMYAVHIPDGGPDENKMAADTFVTWVKNQQQNTGDGYLYVFANGKNRSLAGKNSTSAEDEAKYIKKKLKNPKTTLYRIVKNLGPDSGGYGANSAAIMLERVIASSDNPGGCAIWYKQDFGKINWINGGKAETSQYKHRPQYCGTKIPDNLNSSWWRMSDKNCDLISI